MLKPFVLNGVITNFLGGVPWPSRNRLVKSSREWPRSHVGQRLIPNMAMSNKRCRKANFSNAETRVLLEEVGIEKNMLSSCFSNEITNSMKRAVWAKIQRFWIVAILPESCTSQTSTRRRAHMSVFLRPPEKLWSIHTVLQTSCSSTWDTK